MKARKIEILESYFRTENEHWNSYAFEMFCEILRQGRFKKPETALELVSHSIDIVTNHPEHSLKAIQLLTAEIEKQNLDPDQKLFVYEWVCKYLDQFEFDFDHTSIKELLSTQKEKLKAEIQSAKPLTKNIRETLKEMMHRELEKLPDTLKTLDPVQRLNILCKLMPFVLPKVESVIHNMGEPGESDFNSSW